MCLYTHLKLWKKVTMYNSVCLRSQKYKFKLYTMPRRAVTHLHALRCFTTSSSVELHGPSEEDYGSSGVSSSLERLAFIYH